MDGSPGVLCLEFQLDDELTDFDALRAIRDRTGASLFRFVTADRLERVAQCAFAEDGAVLRKPLDPPAIQPIPASTSRSGRPLFMRKETRRREYVLQGFCHRTA